MDAPTFKRYLAQFAGPVSAAAVCVLLVLAVLFVPLEVRHSAPFGVVQTLDTERSVAVSGARFQATYDNFDRVDLDLRAYTSNEAGDRIDLILHVRGDQEGAGVLRSVPFTVSGWQIADRKPAFDDVFTTVRFDPIDDSAGHEYYIWVERGPRNTDDVVTLWSFKAYSTVTAGTVFASFVEQVPWQVSLAVRWVVFVTIGVVLLGSFGTMLAVFIQHAVRSLLGGSLRRRRVAHERRAAS